MSKAEGVDLAAKYLIALVLIIGSFLIIYQGRGDEVQAWLLLGIVAGWLVRDSSANASTSNMVRLAQAQPTVTTGGQPPVTRVEPPQPERDVLQPSSVARVEPRDDAAGPH